MADNRPILVTGAAGQLGGVGRMVTGLLLDRGLSVRAMVRREDDRSAALRAAGAEVVVGDLLEPADVYRVVSGCRRIYFGMSVSAGYLEATVTMAAVAREVGVNALVNMSQMTVSQMSIQNTTPSPQQRQHWLSEQVLAWSGLPVVTIRPTMFLESFLPLAAASVRDRGRIELPFGRGKTSPVAAADVTRVVAAVLADPVPHLGRLYELTGPRSQDMNGIAQEFSDALNREITYSESPAEDWERELKRLGLPEHLTRHVVTMGELHRAGRYDRLADGVQRVTGRPAMSVREFVSPHADEFGGRCLEQKTIHKCETPLACHHYCPDGTIIAPARLEVRVVGGKPQSLRPFSILCGWPPEERSSVYGQGLKEIRVDRRLGIRSIHDGKPADGAVHKTCFACHEPAKARDFCLHPLRTLSASDGVQSRHQKKEQQT